MKTLQESLFDTDLATKDLSREAILNQVFKNIKELADALTIYFKGELKTPIKILKSRAVFRNPITEIPYVVGDHFTLTSEKYQKEIRFGVSSTSKKFLLMQCIFLDFHGGRTRGNILGERNKPYEFGKDNFFEWFTNRDGEFMKFPMWQVFGLKDKMKKNLQESLFDKDLTIKKTAPEKLAYVLKKFFGNNIGLCQDHQGKTVWYEINPLTMERGLDRQSLIRIIKYCEKIDEFEIINTGSKLTIGVGDYWVYLQLHVTVRVSKELYECGALPIDNTGVTQRGWSEWQGQRL